MKNRFVLFDRNEEDSRLREANREAVRVLGRGIACDDCLGSEKRRAVAFVIHKAPPNDGAIDFLVSYLCPRCADLFAMKFSKHERVDSVLVNGKKVL